MGGIFAAMQNTAVHLGMQRLHAAIEHFWKAGKVGDVFDCNAGIAQQLGGASGGNQFDAKVGEPAREIDEAGLVGNAENGALYLGGSAGHDRPRRIEGERGVTENSISNRVWRRFQLAGGGGRKRIRNGWTRS